jgi:hypothetical protein
MGFAPSSKALKAGLDPAAALAGGRDPARLRPDLNPVELLWANVIDVELTNLCPGGMNVSPQPRLPELLQLLGRHNSLILAAAADNC